MNYLKKYPIKKLANIIEFYWEFEGEFSDVYTYKHSATASVNPKLAFQCEEGMTMSKDGNKDTLFTSGFQFQTNSFYQMSAHKKVRIFGISFQPGAIRLLFKTPANLLTNSQIEISDLLGNEGENLQDKIINCSNMEQRIWVINSFIEDKLILSHYKENNLLNSIHTIKFHKGNVNIKELSSLYCLSQRQFERQFNGLTGFSPKTFASIIRFEECVKLAYLKRKSLTELALSAGYYDQSHMIRDFRKLTGKNPKEYFFEDHSIFFV